MTIDTYSVATPVRLNFAAENVTKAEKTLAGMLSKAFIADAAKVVSSTFAAEVPVLLGDLKTALLSGEPLESIGVALANNFESLAEDGVAKPYDHAAGKALAADFTTARTNALYSLLPSDIISKSTFNKDIGKLKTGLETGHGFAALLLLF